MHLHWVVISVSIVTSTALQCPNGGKWCGNNKIWAFKFFNAYLVNEANVTGYFKDKEFKSWKRPVKHFDTPVNVGIEFYLFSIINVVSYS